MKNSRKANVVYPNFDSRLFGFYIFQNPKIHRVEILQIQFELQKISSKRKDFII